MGLRQKKPRSLYKQTRKPWFRIPSPPPKQYNPNLLTIGQGVGFVVFMEEIEDW